MCFIYYYLLIICISYFMRWEQLAWMDRIGPDQGFLSSLPSTANVLSQSGSELDSPEASSIISNAAEHMTAWLQELLCDHTVNYPDSLWLGSFRLSASLCVRSGARAGQGPLAVPLSWAESLSLPISSYGCRQWPCILLPSHPEMIPLWWRWAL